MGIQSLIPFGLDAASEKLVDVGSVKRGNACGCICPSCKTPLVARHGDEKEWHFSRVFKILLREQMRLWEPPRVDVHVIATSGRFTSDAVAMIEKQNHSDSALRIEMWPESHLERLLASRPAIIGEFSLR